MTDSITLEDVQRCIDSLRFIDNPVSKPVPPISNLSSYTLDGIIPIYESQFLCRSEPITVATMPITWTWHRRLRFRFEDFLRRISAERLWQYLPTETVVPMNEIYLLNGVGMVMHPMIVHRLRQALHI